jgi:hypothetical protein
MKRKEVPTFAKERLEKQHIDCDTISEFELHLKRIKDATELDFEVKMVLHGESSSDAHRIGRLAVHRSSDTYNNTWTNGLVVLLLIIKCEQYIFYSRLSHCSTIKRMLVHQILCLK